LNEFRSEFKALIHENRKGNAVIQHYLMTRAIKI